MKRLFGAFLALVCLVALSGTGQAQQTGVLVSGIGTNSLIGYLPMAAGTIPIGQGVTSNPAAALLSGDCTMNSAGAVTCTKTNGTLFGTAALANVGTSGANLPQLNASNTWASGTLQSFGGHVASSGTTPTITSGGGTSPTIVGDDKDFLLTMGTGTPTTATITFASTYTSVPNCTVSWQGNPLAVQNYVVTGSTIVVNQTATSSNKINGHCAAQSGG